MYVRSYLSSALEDIPSGACLLGHKNIHQALVANTQSLRGTYY